MPFGAGFGPITVLDSVAADRMVSEDPGTLARAEGGAEAAKERS